MRRTNRGVLLSAVLVLLACGTEDEPTGSGGGGSSGAAGLSLSDAGSSNDGGEPNDDGMSVAGGVPGEGGTSSEQAGSISGGSGGSSTGGAAFYLPCESEADCKAFGGGKVCCVAGPMHFCTKQSACSGEMLP